MVKQIALNTNGIHQYGFAKVAILNCSIKVVMTNSFRGAP